MTTNGNDNGWAKSAAHPGRPELRLIHRTDDFDSASPSTGTISSTTSRVVPVGRMAHRMLRQWQSTSFIEDLESAD